MKLKILLFILFVPFFTNAQVDYQKYFINKSFRFDFLLGGNNKEVTVFPQQMKQESFWAGSKTNLIDPFNYGSYRFRIFDIKSDSLIFSKGFSTLFQEWQTTAEAKTTTKTFYQAAIFPFPKKNFRIDIDARQWDGTFKTLYSSEIAPDNYFIQKETPTSFEIFDILKNGKSSQKVDLVILAEGYVESEMNKFIEDAKRVSTYLLDEEPFKSEKESFNIKAVFTPSAESGTDIPGEGVYHNTFFNSTFYTFDLPRYLTTSDMKTIYDAAAQVPYDQIYILVNTERYGGGGFYNFITVCTADNTLTKEVFVHEFGHGFAGLGDEYYTSTVAYEDFYNLETEPWEPNLTTLVDFDSKWKKLIDKSTPIPTPRESKYRNTVGVYEGGGYLSKGIYSPHIDCRMKSNEAGKFCPVCSEAIKKVIKYYTE
ncbi:M64 family metallopeptidase [Maribellus maritimus]|uniref:M64 family metallopeptidase n=1 Tax=Maribellus maritimus TaxID=2870838 RepID=UPI001EE9C7D4|nr:M64 family metallopeptidase [Maribellus maritimus]MCG6187163.1 IgA Peptidase M64 [Maribellus maritimus]